MSANKKKQWWLYVLECGDGSLYAGVSSDPDRRYRVHKCGRGAKYTRAKGVKAMVWKSEIGTKSEALRLEHAFKQLTRLQKLKFLSELIKLTRTI